MTKGKQIKIEKVVITIGKKELLLSIDEAKELKSALDELFQPKEIHHWHTKEVYKDRYPWTQPYYQPIYYSNTAAPDIDLVPKITCLALGSESI